LQLLQLQQLPLERSTATSQIVKDRNAVRCPKQFHVIVRDHWLSLDNPISRKSSTLELVSPPSSKAPSNAPLSHGAWKYTNKNLPESKIDESISTNDSEGKLIQITNEAEAEKLRVTKEAEGRAGRRHEGPRGVEAIAQAEAISKIAEQLTKVGWEEALV
ncbi:hypothetical protein ACHAW6_013830, partial [Cyclotella cf. meneghiniana]